MNNAVFWDVMSRGACKTEVSEERIGSVIRVTRIGELGTTSAAFLLCSVRRLLVTANVIPNSPILVTLMTERPHSSEMSVPIRAI
jgi:hypothetical protein